MEINHKARGLVRTIIYSTLLITILSFAHRLDTDFSIKAKLAKVCLTEQFIWIIQLVRSYLYKLKGEIGPNTSYRNQEELSQAVDE